MLGVLPAGFHPPTRAHMALARAALPRVDEVLLVLPRDFPHKSYERVGLPGRLDLLAALTSSEPRFSAGVSEGGLFIDIAGECREAYGPGVDLWFLCGRDAAERVANWDYAGRGSFAGMLEQFGLLVAPREGVFVPPPVSSHRIRLLQPAEDLSGISSTEVRNRIARGEPWRHLVPPEIADLVAKTYS